MLFKMKETKTENFSSEKFTIKASKVSFFIFIFNPVIDTSKLLNVTKRELIIEETFLLLFS